MERERLGESSNVPRRGRRGAVSTALRRGALALLVILAAITSAAAQELEPEEALPGSGIRYPRGYDTETEGVVEGRLLRVEVPQRGPVVLRLESGGRAVAVFVAPAWYWELAEGRPTPGELVRVVGSKTLGADGELYVVARELEPVAGGCRRALRDEGGRPLWRGRMHGEGPGRCLPPEERRQRRP